MVEYCYDNLGSLIKYDKNNNENLCYHLERFLLNNGNIAETARELFLHSNTLSYQLKKISKILEKDINDARVRFNLFFALMIKKLFVDRKE